MDERIRRAPVTRSQKNALIQFLKNHPQLVFVKFSSSFTKKDAQKLWVKASKEINALPGGSKKEWFQWRKTWQDLKKNTLKSKKALEKMAAIGCRPYKDIKWDSTDEHIMKLVAPERIHEDVSVPVPEITADVKTETTLAPETSTTTSMIEAEGSQAGSIEECEASTSAIHRSLNRKRALKARRLNSSMKISKSLLKIRQEQKEAADQYFSHKIAYLSWRRSYEEKKLKLMENDLKCKKLILEKLIKLNEK